MTGAETIKAADTILKFKDQIFKAVGIAKDELKHFFDGGVENYLTVQFQKYSFTKTFLYRETPVEFYQTFFPISIKNNKRIVTTENLTEFLGFNQFVGIVGAAGSGKTMLMKHVFLQSFNQTFKIPIVIELRNLNTYGGTFSDYLLQAILDNKLALNDKILKRLLSNGSFIFLLDGYDEIFSDKKQILTEEIDKFIDKNNRNNFVISSRPGASIESLPRFSFYHVQPLSTDDINKFIDLQIQYFEDKELMIKIKELIQQTANRDFTKFVTNPLLLSMFILTYSDHPELPKLKSTFYYNVYDTLATKHDTITKRGGYQHERHSGLQKDEIFNFLKFFSVQSLFEGNYTFDDQYYNTLADKVKMNLKLKFDNEKLLYDLIVSINVFLRDGSLITYPHKSLQEYLAAACISSQNVEFKQKVYEEKLIRNSNKSTGGINNFYDLLLELDKEQFINKFIIPNAKATFKKFNFSDTVDPIQLSKIYIKKTNLSHSVSVKGKKMILLGDEIMTSDFNLDVALLLTRSIDKFVSLEDQDVHRNKDLLFKLFREKKFSKIEMTNAYYISYNEFSDVELGEFLENSSLPNKILAMFKKLKSKFEQTIKELNEESESKIMFLD